MCWWDIMRRDTQPTQLFGDLGRMLSRRMSRQVRLKQGKIKGARRVNAG